MHCTTPHYTSVDCSIVRAACNHHSACIILTATLLCLQGEWTGEMGGNRDMVTWMNNPKVRLFIEDSGTDCDEGGRG